MKTSICFVMLYFVCFCVGMTVSAQETESTVIPYMRNFALLLEEEKKSPEPTWFLAEIIFYAAFLGNTHDIEVIAQKAGIENLLELHIEAGEQIRRFYEKPDIAPFNPVMLIQNSLPAFKKTEVERLLQLEVGTLSQKINYQSVASIPHIDEHKLRRMVIAAYNRADALSDEFAVAENKNDVIMRTLREPQVLYIIASDVRYESFFHIIQTQFPEVKKQLCSLIGIDQYEELVSTCGENPWSFAGLNGGIIVLPEVFNSLAENVHVGGNFGIVLLSPERVPYRRVMQEAVQTDAGSVSKTDMSSAELVYIVNGLLRDIHCSSMEYGFPLEMVYPRDIYMFAKEVQENPLVLLALSDEELRVTASFAESAQYFAEAYCRRVNILLQREASL